MNERHRQLSAATISLAGTIIGVGIFGIPYVIGQVGAIPALVYFLVLGGVQTLLHLFFAEAAIACPDIHGLPGLARVHLGSAAGRIGGVALILGYWASLTAYVAVGGTFLAIILRPVFGGGDPFYSLVWGIVGALIVRFGMRVFTRLETVGTVALILTLVGILAVAVPHVRVANMPAWNLIDPVVPYGVILFSLIGLSVIPEMKGMVKGRVGDYRWAVVVGTAIAAAVTMAFGFVVWGVVGHRVAKDAVSGLNDVLGAGIAVPVAVAGFLAVATSYLATAVNVRDSFHFDFRLSPTVAWLLAVSPPMAIFLFGGRDFLVMIGLSGAVFGGILSVLVGLMYLKIRRQGLVSGKPLRVPAVFAYITILVLGIGAVVETWDYLGGLLS
ncbi:hypothetical protein JW899_01600 [Candidatus Uhrbacteria bacterium]|nr:hypothetical protein [Candidatus Uhrbacteria bacterium]